MVEFAGWDMPVQFESIVDEHKATRAAAGLFDVSHMGEATVVGPQAEAFLNYVLTNDVARMEDGKVLYSLMCYEHGGVVDDLLVYRRSQTSYLLCLNASNAEKDVTWLQGVASGFDVEVRDVSRDYGLIALQGPKAFDILRHLTDADLSGLRYYHFLEGNVATSPTIISRTGYTGEVGVELFVPWEQTECVAEEILREGVGSGLRLAGLGARDSLRLEAGYSLYGHEINHDISPVTAGLMWTVRLDKAGDFIGKKAIAAEKRSGPARKVVFFNTGSRRIARPGLPVVSGGRVIGEVLSGTFSPMLNEAIGSAIVESAFAGHGDLAVDMKGKEMPIFRTKPPFVALNPQA